MSYKDVFRRAIYNVVYTRGMQLCLRLTCEDSFVWRSSSAFTKQNVERSLASILSTVSVWRQKNESYYVVLLSNVASTGLFRS